MSDTDNKAERAANLFDLRRIIGGVFIAWGVLLIILGLFDSRGGDRQGRGGAHQPLRRASGCSSFGLLLLLWAFTRPLGQELAESEQASGSAGERRRGHPPAGRLRGVGARALNRRSRRRPSGRRRLRRPSGAPPWLPPRARTPRSRRAARRGTRRAVAATVSRSSGVQGGGRRFDAGVLAHHVPDAPLQHAVQLARRRVAERRDAERLAGGAALGAALVVAAGGEIVRRARVHRDELPVAEVQRMRIDGERAEVDPQHVRRRASTATRVGRAGRSPRPPSRSPRASTASPARRDRRARRPSSASASAASSAAEEERPLPCGTSPVIVRCAGATSNPAARSSATIPRGKARQPSARSGSSNSSRSPGSRASTTKRRAGSAVTVTPRSIANGIASPSL